jgi:hypothetical protein
MVVSIGVFFSLMMAGLDLDAIRASERIAVLADSRPGPGVLRSLGRGGGRDT